MNFKGRRGIAPKALSSALPLMTEGPKAPPDSQPFGLPFNKSWIRYCMQLSNEDTLGVRTCKSLVVENACTCCNELFSNYFLLLRKAILYTSKYMLTVMSLFILLISFKFCKIDIFLVFNKLISYTLYSYVQKRIQQFL